MYLSPQVYDRLEQDGIENITSAQLIEAFHPITFNKTGYPTRISKEKELIRYVDTMHSLRFENDYNTLIGGAITTNELNLLKELTRKICLFCESKFEHKMIATSSVLRMLNIYRHIQYIFHDTVPRVFEIGPGSGYLGALFMLTNTPYAATDITQAFYIYQNQFWNFISNNQMIELADQDNLNLIKTPSEVAPIHIPWWKFSSLKPNQIPRFNVVTANHALCEMNKDALRFTLRIAYRMLRGKGNNNLFIFEGWGEEAATLHTPNRAGVSSIKDVVNEFYKAGFELIHNDSYITIFSVSNNPNNYDLRDNFLKNTKFLKLKILFRKLSGIPYHDNEKYRFSIDNYYKKSDNISELIFNKRKINQNESKIKIDKINSFYAEILNSKDFSSPDDQFFRFVNRSSY